MNQSSFLPESKGSLCIVNCKDSVCGDKCNTNCEIVSMNDISIKNRPIQGPMMTFGLGGCTAVIIVTKEEIVLSHY